MAEVIRTKFVRRGAWRTLEYGWNARFSVRFFSPAGARVKVRYGIGWFGWDSQKQTLSGTSPALLRVGGASVAYARVQMLVQADSEVTYTYIASDS